MIVFQFVINLIGQVHIHQDAGKNNIFTSVGGTISFDDRFTEHDKYTSTKYMQNRRGPARVA